MTRDYEIFYELYRVHIALIIRSHHSVSTTVLQNPYECGLNRGIEQRILNPFRPIVTTKSQILYDAPRDTKNRATSLYKCN